MHLNRFSNGILHAYAPSVATLLILACTYCEARRVSLEGVGISIRFTDRVYRYKSDHLDTASWARGLIFPRSAVPSRVVGVEYATHDFRPAADDSRTDDRISRIRADAPGDLLIAMPSADATGDGWGRLNPGTDPDYYLDYATRKGTFTPDDKSPYWFYRRSYETPGTWVRLPVNSVVTDHPPFVFAAKGELYWENPPALMAHAVTIARKPDGGRNTSVVNPKLLILSNGDYLAGLYGAAGTRGTSLWRSRDRGATWALLADGFETNRDSVFELRGSIYLLGLDRTGEGKTRIYKSSDDGATWTTRVFAGLGGDDAPSHVDVVNGRVWKAALAEGGPGFFSAPVDADLMKESSWTLAGPGVTWGEHHLANGQGFRPGNEGTLLTTKEGFLINLGKDKVFRPGSGWQEGIALVQMDPHGVTKTMHNPDYAGPTLPGTGSKFTGRYDPVSDRYWALTSGGPSRGELNLYSAEAVDGRIGDFRFRARILQGHSTGYHGFNYPFMQIDGDDIVFVLRTGWDHHRGTSDRWHDADLFTFHRIKGFRDLGVGNYIANPGFEDGMAGWLTLPIRDDAAGTRNQAHTGTRNLAHGQSRAYRVCTYRTITGLVAGEYTLRAWGRSSGGQKACYLAAKDYGGADLTRDLPATSTYTQIEIPHIQVTSGTCTIGLWSDANAGDWAAIDDVEFFSHPADGP